MEIEVISPAEIPYVWHEVKSMVDEALVHSNGELLSSDLLSNLLAGESILLLGKKDDKIFSSLIAEYQEHPRKKSLYIVAWTTESRQGFNGWAELFEEKLITIAKELECDYLETWCRRGLAKKLRTQLGWTSEYSVVTKPIIYNNGKR